MIPKIFLIGFTILNQCTYVLGVHLQGQNDLCLKIWIKVPMVSLVPPKRKKKVLRLHIIESMLKGDYGLLQSIDLVHLPKGFMSLSKDFLQHN